MPGRDLPKTLTGDELDRLLAMPNLDVPTGLRDRCVLELMCRCGLRVSEVCGLYLRDVDWRAGESASVRRSRRAAATLSCTSTSLTLALLDRWKAARRPLGAGKPHLFVAVRSATRGAPLARRAVHKMVARRAQKAGIDRPVWPHMLRHTFATSLLAEGFTISEVQRLMRHADLRTTAVYLEVRDVDLARKIRRRRST